jgi:hypothetical protein
LPKREWAQPIIQAVILVSLDVPPLYITANFD